MTRAALPLLALLLVFAAPAAASTGGPDTQPLRRAGSWMVDEQGRVFVGHGVNVVKKVVPYVRSEFTDSDARMLADEGFTVVRIGFIWAGAEPQPGVYDDRYIDKVLALDDLLARYGIRTMVDVHQDSWSESTGGDGAPAWATLGSTADQSFAAFWRDDPGPGGVGIQTRFAALWQHLANRLKSHPNVIGLDPFNEPYPGSDYPPPCGDFTPCPAFETGALAAFYRRVIAAIRAGGAPQTIWPEAIADSGSQEPSLPAFDDPQTAFHYHYYCNVTQLDPRSAPVTELSPEAAACRPLEQRNLGNYASYLKRTGVPGFLGEFSCNDVNRDNAQVVDITDAAFTSWTIWAYYTAADDPADCPAQGLLADDSKPGVAKPLKLDALAVPHAQAIAGTPESTALDRGTRTFTLRYKSAPVPGAKLSSGAPTQVFVPQRMYPDGYTAQVSGGTVVSSAGAPWLLVRAAPGADVTVTVTPAAGSTTTRPLATAALPVPVCAARRTVAIRVPGGARLRKVTVAGRRVKARVEHGRVTVVVSGYTRPVHFAVVARRKGGGRFKRVKTVRLCRVSR